MERRQLVAAVTVGVALAAAMAVAVSPAHAESNGGVRVMPLGDSITDGLTVPGGYRINLWQKVQAGGYKVDFVGSQFNGPSGLGDHDHEGHSGWTISQVDANIVSWLQTYTPRTILLHIGTNDMIGSASGAPARLGTLLDHITATAPNAEVFVSTIIPLSMADAAVRTFNAAVPGIVQTRANAGKHVHLVEMYSALTTADLADGVHPNAGGYAKMATVWYNALLSVPGSLGDGASSPPPSSPSSPSSSSSPSSPSRPPSSSASSSPPSSPPVGGACSASYRLVSSWSTGFQAEVTVKNNGSSTLNGWTVALTLASGQSVSNLWNGVATGTSGAVTVKNAAYNGTLAGNGSTVFGFVANGSSATAPTIGSCTSP